MALSLLAAVSGRCTSQHRPFLLTRAAAALAQEGAWWGLAGVVALYGMVLGRFPEHPARMALAQPRSDHLLVRVERKRLTVLYRVLSATRYVVP